MKTSVTPAQKRALDRMRSRMLKRAYPAKIETAYLRQLNALLDAISADALETIKATPGYTADSFSDYVARLIESFMGRWASHRVRQFAEHVARMFVSDSLSQAVRDVQFPNEDDAFSVNGVQSPEMREALRIATEQNAQLIQSIARQHCDAIASKVYANVQAGARPSSLVSEIRDYGATKARAKFIARDQTAKVMSTISRVRQQAAGFRYFRWSTSHDERVRQEHRDVANRITPYGKGVYAWDDLPVIHGERLAPGGDFQCRCVALPVADWEVEEWKRKKSS